MMLLDVHLHVEIAILAPKALMSCFFLSEDGLGKHSLGHVDLLFSRFRHETTSVAATAVVEETDSVASTADSFGLLSPQVQLSLSTASKAFLEARAFAFPADCFALQPDNLDDAFDSIEQADLHSFVDVLTLDRPAHRPIRPAEVRVLLVEGVALFVSFVALGIFFVGLALRFFGGAKRTVVEAPPMRIGEHFEGLPKLMEALHCFL